MDRLFLDANVLFSASYRPSAGLLKLWRVKGVQLLTSDYALQEAVSNMESSGQRARLEKLIKCVRIINRESDILLPEDITLPEKDRPILKAAVAAGANYLLTGDFRHFGPLFGQIIFGVCILPPAEYLRIRNRRN